MILPHLVCRCRQLLSEQEVQARATDAARANVEAHYAYITSAQQGFMGRYAAQHAQHARMLGSFQGDMAALAAVELHPKLQVGWPDDNTEVVKAMRMALLAGKSQDCFQ